MSARVVRVIAELGDSDIVCDVLWQHGPLAVSEEPTVGDPAVVAIVAGYDSDADAAGAFASVRDRWPTTLESADDSDGWVESWRCREPAHHIGPFHLRLPEHPRSGDGLDLVIEPGPTFGFSHATTLLSLELLAELELDGRAVADIGCGSGVLAVAAALMGAGPVHAVDIDPAAVRQSADNVVRHGLDDLVSVRAGTAEQLKDRFDVVVANMLAPALLESATAMREALAPMGSLVVSGFLAHDVDRIATALLPLTPRATRDRDGWAATVFAS